MTRTDLYFTVAAPQTSGLDVTNLDPVVHQLCKKGLAQSTQKTYDSAIKRFSSFCSLYSIASPFPVSEPILCYYAAYLLTQRLAPQTIKTYLAAIRYMQVLLGLPEPRQFTSLPCLQLLQRGIQRTHAQENPPPTRTRLPITPTMLERIRVLLSQPPLEHDTIMLWAAASLYFFGFFPLGGTNSSDN